jgi:hypothetical protein
MIDEKEKEPILPRIISIVLHPFFMAVYGVCLLFVYTDFKFIFAGQFLVFIAPVFVFTLLIPVNIIYILKRMGLIKDYDLKDRKDRLGPFVAILLCYILLFYYFYSAGMYIWFLALLLAPCILIIISAIITIYWKISAHMMGIGGLIGGVLSVCYFVKGTNPYVLFIVLFILAGCLGTARLILKRHTPAQVYAGFLLGFTITALCVWVGANFAYLYLKFKYL